MLSYTIIAGKRRALGPESSPNACKSFCKRKKRHVLYKSNTDCEIIVRKFAIQDDVGHDFLTFVVRAFSSDIENPNRISQSNTIMPRARFTKSPPRLMTHDFDTHV